MTQLTEIDVRHYRSLSRAFSPLVLNDLMRHGKSEYLSEVVSHSGFGARIDLSQSLRGFFDDLFNHLSEHYCSEYIYKNALAEQMYLGKHFEDSHMLTELRVGPCKADVVILNGTSTVYEIKSDLDSLERLDSQISAYTSFFDQINVISSLSQVEKLQTQLSKEIGIMALGPKNAIEVIRKPQSNKSHVEPSVIFDTLRKNEYLRIIRENFGSVPDVPNTRIHQACSDLFCELAPEAAHDAMLGALKRRGNKRLRDFVSRAPTSLKASVSSLDKSAAGVDRFLELLEHSAHSVLSRTT